MSIAVLIPAYRPGAQLSRLVVDLIASTIVVVDDGSGDDYRAVFDAIAGRATVLRHPENLGKGAALKTGLRWLLVNDPDWTGVVTADADGQHHADDIARVAGILAARPAVLVLGCRQFGGETPWPNRIGNLATRRVVRLVMGQKLADTQTGLRGIPRALASTLVEIGSNGYEFELEMLIAARHRSVPVVEVSIRTVYFAGDRGSHFDPLLDSMRIYAAVLRFTGVSLATAAIDTLVFWCALSTGAAVELAQFSGRAVAGCFTYWAARRAVFLTSEPHRNILPGYVAIVVAVGMVSYSLVVALSPQVGVVPAKLAAEGLLFPLSFVLLRDFVFRSRRELCVGKTPS